MEDEYRRLAALRAYEVLDTPKDPVLDQIAELASCVFETPVACVSLVDSHRLFLKAAEGVDARELGNEPGMCVTTVKTNAQRQVEDLTLDAEGAVHPLVANEPNMRFYAGTPLRSRDGYAIGTLCVLDVRVRHLDDEQMDCLRILGELVMERLEHHRREAERSAQARALDRYGPFVRLGANVSPVGVLDLDQAGRVTRINASAGKVTGLTEGDALQSMALARDADRRRLAQMWERRDELAAQGDTFGVSVQSPSGTSVLLQAELTHGDGGAVGYTATIRELDGLAELGEQMLEAQKLESLGALAGGIAHDFNNVLAAIMGNNSLALASLDPESAAARHLGAIDRATERASNLCDQLLAYSGGGQFTVSAFDLDALVSDMTDLLEVSLPKKVSVTVSPSSEPMSLEGNPTQIRQVIMNILMNAAEAIGDEPGVISVSTGSVTVGADDLEKMYFGDGLAGGDYACLEVVDNGQGMAADTIPRIFDPLFSTKHAGHGLGMAAVGGIMRVHNGALDVRSTVGEGTSITVLLPASSRPADIDLVTDSPASDTRRKGRVLVVEDEPALLEILDEALTAAGFETCCVRDGAEALTAVHSGRGDFAAAVIDMMMPNVDGAELFEHLTASHPDTKVVLTSGYNEREATRRITDAGLAVFLKKPYRPHELVAQLDDLLTTPKPVGRLRRLLRMGAR